jgi:hypothetical protein
MTRSADKINQLQALGADPVLCDVFDAAALSKAVTRFQPDAVLHQLTDLPDDVDQLSEFAPRNDRIRTEGTRNLVAAAQAAGARHLLAQSLAWRPQGRGEVLDQHERQLLDAGGVVVRYGQLYGPGTFYEDEGPATPSHPRGRRGAGHPALDQGPIGSRGPRGGSTAGLISPSPGPAAGGLATRLRTTTSSARLHRQPGGVEAGAGAPRLEGDD